MFCIDWNDDNPIEIMGHEFDSDYTALDIIIVPCNYIHTMFGYQGDSIHPECNGELE